MGTVAYRGDRLTPRQLASLARLAGFRGDDVQVAVAVALAESAGRTRAVGDVHLETGKWGPSVGLWQIRSLRVDKGTGRQRDELANLDPVTNARHAREIAATRRGWRHWSTYSHRSYLRFMPTARAASR